MRTYPNSNLNPSDPVPASSGSTQPQYTSPSPAPLPSVNAPLPSVHAPVAIPDNPNPSNLIHSPEHVSRHHHVTDGGKIQMGISLERFKFVFQRAVKVHHHVDLLSRCMAFGLLPPSFSLDSQPVCYNADEHLRGTWKRILDRTGFELMDSTISHLKICLHQLADECRNVGEGILCFLLDREPGEDSISVRNTFGTYLRGGETIASNHEAKREKKLAWLCRKYKVDPSHLPSVEETTPPLKDLSTRFFASFPTPDSLISDIPSPTNTALSSQIDSQADSQPLNLPTQTQAPQQHTLRPPVYPDATTGHQPLSILGLPRSELWKLGPIPLHLSPQQLVHLFRTRQLRLPPLTGNITRTRAHVPLFSDAGRNTSSTLPLTVSPSDFSVYPRPRPLHMTPPTSITPPTSLVTLTPPTSITPPTSLVTLTSCTTTTVQSSLGGPNASLVSENTPNTLPLTVSRLSSSVYPRPRPLRVTPPIPITPPTSFPKAHSRTWRPLGGGPSCPAPSIRTFPPSEAPLSTVLEPTTITSLLA